MTATTMAVMFSARCLPAPPPRLPPVATVVVAPPADLRWTDALPPPPPPVMRCRRRYISVQSQPPISTQPFIPPWWVSVCLADVEASGGTLCDHGLSTSFDIAQWLCQTAVEYGQHQQRADRAKHEVTGGLVDDKVYPLIQQPRLHNKFNHMQSACTGIGCSRASV